MAFQQAERKLKKIKFYRYGGRKIFELKPGAVVVSARRAGTTATIDQMNKYLLYAQMPVVSSRYWNMVHGQTPDQHQLYPVKKNKEY